MTVPAPRPLRPVTLPRPLPQPLAEPLAQPLIQSRPLPPPLPSPDTPLHDAGALTGPGGIGLIRLGDQVYTLRITRAGKLILTK